MGRWRGWALAVLLWLFTFGHAPVGTIRAQSGEQYAAILQAQDGTFDIYLLELDGQTLRPLVNLTAQDSLSAYTYLSWSPDGSKLTFAGQSQGDQGAQVYIIDPDGGNLRDLTDTLNTLNIDPQWSPDGNRLAFVSTRDNGQIGRVYLMEVDINVDVTQAQPLTPPEVNALAPAWSPDGSQIAYYAQNADGLADIYRVNVANQQVTRLTISGVPKYYPQWSPDGRQLYYVQQDDGVYVLYVMNADGGDPRPIYAPAQDARFVFRVLYNLAVLPSGRELLVIQNDVVRGQGNRYVETRIPYLVDLDQGFLTPLFIDPQYAVIRLVRRPVPGEAPIGGDETTSTPPPDGTPALDVTRLSSPTPDVAPATASQPVTTAVPRTVTTATREVTRLLSPTPRTPTLTHTPSPTRTPSRTRTATATRQVTRFVSPTRRMTATATLTTTPTPSPTLTNTPAPCTVEINSVLQQSEVLVVNYRYVGPPSTMSLLIVGGADLANPTGIIATESAPSLPSGAIRILIERIRDGEFTLRLAIELCSAQRKLNKFGQQVLTLGGERLPEQATASALDPITSVLVATPIVIVVAVIVVVLVRRRRLRA
jgi:hypothetical protein